MDETDIKILKILAENANTTSTEIGQVVGLSIPAVNKRIQKLQQEQVIRQFTIVADREKVGKQVQAFILVILQSADAATQLLEYVKKEPDVLECHAVTGEYDYLIKVCAADIRALEEMLLCLKKQKGVIKSHTMLGLMEHKFSPTALP